MKFSLNHFLMSLSYALDYIEIDLLGVASAHSKRVAYVAANIGKELGNTQDELYDLIALALLHDIGRCKNWQSDDYFNATPLQRKEFDEQHCIEGQKIVEALHLNALAKDTLLLHHECYDGSGMFGKKGNEIPRISQVIALADSLEKRFQLMDTLKHDRRQIIEFISDNKGILYSEEVANACIKACSKVIFWIELKNDNIDGGLQRMIPNQYMDVSWKQTRKLTSVFSKIIDMKSSFTNDHSRQLAEKTGEMADYYHKGEEEKYKLLIAADLHDLGKLVVSNKILYKNGRLDQKEYTKIQEHPYYTRKCLEQLTEFEDITEWASNHHEKLNGNGYPFGKKAEELDFNSRLLVCLDIYQALVEERPYKKAFDHHKAISILTSMADNGEVDKKIVEDIKKVFQPRK